MTCSSGDHVIGQTSYVYLVNSRDPGAYIASFAVPAHTHRKDVSFDADLLTLGESYYVAWASCNCPRKNSIAQSAVCEVVARALSPPLVDPQSKISRYWFNCSPEERDVLRRHFRDADLDGNESISRAELKAYYDKKLHEKLYDSEIDEMINEADIGKPDGRIQFGEFVDICCLAKARETSVKWQNLYRQFASEMAHANKRARI